MYPLVSVVVPVFNREGLIVRTLDSLWSQSYPNLEIIVVDNNSTDQSQEIVKNYMQLHSNDEVTRSSKLLYEEKQGASFARQKGLENAHGELVIFFDSDDTMQPCLIKKAVDTIESDADLDIVCWKCRLHLLDGKRRVPPVLIRSHLEGHLIHCLLRPQGFMVKTKLIKQIGGWNKPLKVWDDLELGFRLLSQNPKIGVIDEILADVFSQRDSMTGEGFISKKGEWEEALKEIRKENAKSLQSIKAKTEMLLDYRIAILAAHYAKEGDKKAAKALFKSLTTVCNTAPAGGLYKILYRGCLKFCYHYTRFGFRGAWIIFCGVSRIFPQLSQRNY